MQHKEQRVLVLFDVQNLYYSAKHIYNTKVNFKEILKKAVMGRKLIRAIAYVIRADIKDEGNFHEALNKIGIEVKAKELQIFFGGAKKGDWDIGIAMDAVRLAEKVDTVVLVSGDGDFKDLLSYLKSHGCRTEVLAFGKTTSKLLREETDMFFDLSLDLRKYLLGSIRDIRHRAGSFEPRGPEVKVDAKEAPEAKGEVQVKADALVVKDVPEAKGEVHEVKADALESKEVPKAKVDAPVVNPTNGNAHPGEKPEFRPFRERPRFRSDKPFRERRPFNKDRPPFRGSRDGNFRDRKPMRSSFQRSPDPDEVQDAVMQANLSQPDEK